MKSFIFMYGFIGLIYMFGTTLAAFDERTILHHKSPLGTFGFVLMSGAFWPVVAVIQVQMFYPTIATKGVNGG